MLKDVCLGSCSSVIVWLTESALLFANWLFLSLTSVLAAASTTLFVLRAGLGAETRTLAGRRAAHEAVTAAIATSWLFHGLRLGSLRV